MDNILFIFAVEWLNIPPWITLTIITILIPYIVLLISIGKTKSKAITDLMNKKADVTYVKDNIDKVEIKITNLTTLNNHLTKKVDNFNDDINKLSIRIDKKLEGHQQQIIEIIKGMK